MSYIEGGLLQLINILSSNQYIDRSLNLSTILQDAPSTWHRSKTFQYSINAPWMHPAAKTGIVKRNHQQPLTSLLPLLPQPYKPRWADMWARYRGITARENGTFGGQALSSLDRATETGGGLLMSWPLTGLKAEMSLSAVFLGVHDCMRIKGQHVSSSPVLLFVLFSVFSEELS
ncbi:Uncharacterized protein HZ326_3670 [Fusarium oxysporum f. sp. albedinis]|nr:Uncharacterized protein HZ326_3670 [Fusarium oxysporum f. sp. albedinis]